MSQKYIQLKNFDDFVRLITLSPTPFIEYVNLDNHNLYFIQIVGISESVLYYVELDKKIEEKYVLYNRFRDTISFSTKIESDGQNICVPILEVLRTNAFPEYPPKQGFK